MTEKKQRFINKGKHIFQHGEWWCSARGEHCADVIATAMNELINKNEELKQKVDFYKYFQKDARELEKENEQLNEDILRRKENEKILIKTANDLNELIDKLEKENEQLEKRLIKLKVENAELKEENEKLWCDGE